MKDVVLWQSVASRVREKQPLNNLAALHQSPIPPHGLSQPIPRKLRWKAVLKLVAMVDVLLLVIAFCMAIWLGVKTTQFYSEMRSFTQKHNGKMRQQAVQTSDSEKRAMADKAIKEDEQFERKWRALYIAMLAGICVVSLLLPATHVGLNWFIHIRPNLLLLRGGVMVRATIIQRKRTFLFVPAVEFGFTTEQGEHIRRTQPLARSEESRFKVGDSVWILYLPRHPKLAQIYGLKFAMAEIVTD